MCRRSYLLWSPVIVVGGVARSSEERRYLNTELEKFFSVGAWRVESIIISIPPHYSSTFRFNHETVLLSVNRGAEI